MKDYLTLLRSLGGLRLAKTWTAEGITPYGSARYVRVREEPVDGIHELAAVLARLESKADVCVVRGKFLGADHAEAVGTLPDLAGGDPLPTWRQAGSGRAYLRRKALFEDAPHHWLALDVDSFRPSVDPVLDPEAAVQEYLARMPGAFAGVTCFWQLSGSAGAPGQEGVLRARIWFWLSMPRTCAELAAWAAASGLADLGLLDATLFRPVQPHYTAAPVVEPGALCPVTRRSGLLQGVWADELDLDLGEDVLARAAAARGRGSQGNPGGDVPDPGSKPGLVGAWCRAWPTLDDLMAADWWDGWLTRDGDSERRLTWHGGGGAVGGAWVVAGPQGGQWVGCTHNTWPGGERLVNLYDLVRLLKYAHLDAAVPAEDRWVQDVGGPASLPSEQAMRAWARTLPEVRRELDAAEAAGGDGGEAGGEAAGDGGDGGEDGGGDGGEAAGAGADSLGKWGRRALKHVRAGLTRLGLTDGEIDGLVDVETARRIWTSCFFQPDKGRLFLLNRAGGLVQFGQADWAPSLVEACGVLVHADTLGRVVDRLAGPGATPAQAKAVRKDVTGAIWDPLLLAIRTYRQRGTVSVKVDMFADKSELVLGEEDARLRLTHSDFPVPAAPVDEVTEEDVLAEYKGHFPEWTDFLDLLIHARFAVDRRRGFHWMHLPASWGKGFLFEGVLGRDGLGIVATISTKEIEGAFEGRPVGVDANTLVRAWILWVDELKAIKGEIKQLNNTITASPKHQLRFVADLYVKAFTSAERVDSLASSAGVESQFAERFTVTSAPERARLPDLPVYTRVGALAYRTVLVRRAAEHLNAGVARMRALGPAEAARVCETWLNGWHARAGIAHRFGTLADGLPGIASEVERLIRDWARRSVGDVAGTTYLTHCPGSLTSLLSASVSVVTGARSKAGLDRPGSLAVCSRPATLVKAWLQTYADVSERVLLGHKASTIADLIGPVACSTAPRIYRDDGTDTRVKAIVLDLYSPEEREQMAGDCGNVVPFAR